MGLFRKRRRRGVGLTGILVILAVLYFTGAGSWLWARMQAFEGQCFSMLAQAGAEAGGSVCGAFGGTVRWFDNALSDVGGTWRSLLDSVHTPILGSGLESAVGELRLTAALNRLGSSDDMISSYMRRGPAALGTQEALSDKMRLAIDSFSIGRNYIGGDGSSAYQAIPWLQQGARVQGYGVLSQLSLGDLYRGGTNTSVMPNPQASISYYTQAFESISLLQRSGSPEARTMLDALPGKPDQVQAQLQEVIRSLQAQQRGY